MFLIGYDIGSSSVKAALVNATTGATMTVSHPADGVMPIAAPHPGWAEQDPGMWWHHVCLATRELLALNAVEPQDIKGIGISYQMHGLVCLDKDQEVIRPAIIWCDSRAVDIGQRAFDSIGHTQCLTHVLNAPGNFTASKLKWVRDHEPDVYGRIHTAMLPGDYIAMKLTGEAQTTIGGLSEGILWDFIEERPADLVLDHFGIDKGMLAQIVPTIGVQAQVSVQAAAETGLAAGTPVCYRGGDQPNHAMTLNVLEPGEIAATGGTSGVIYGVTDQLLYDPRSRVNGFAHVNHTQANPRIGMLLCINGAGIQYQWIKDQVAHFGMEYVHLEAEGEMIPIGSDGLVILPFGNGAERMLEHRDPGAQIMYVQFNRHQRGHMYRAALEGVAFAFIYGAQILQEMGLDLRRLRVGNDNLFRSRIFSETIAHALDTEIEIYETTGAIGAAKAAGVGAGIYPDISEAMRGGKLVRHYAPEGNTEAYREAYGRWERCLGEALSAKS